MLYFDASARKVHAMNGSGRAPAGLTLEAIRAAHGDVQTIPPAHAHAITVPGTAAGWFDAFERFGSGNLTFAQLLAPATALAEEGFSVGPVTALQWAHCAQQLRQSPNAHVGDIVHLLLPLKCCDNSFVRSQELLAEDGTAPVPGKLFRNPHVAAVMRTLGTEGKAGFYGGAVGQAIVEEVQAQGGVMTLEDLAKHETTWPEPISTVYKGIRSVCSSGIFICASWPFI